MKKIIKKIKKTIMSVVVFLIALPSKIFAITPSSMEILYGVPEELYGSPRTIAMNEIWKIARIFIIPIILLIGIIIYLKNSKSTKRVKLIVTLTTLIIGTIVYFFINYHLN